MFTSTIPESKAAAPRGVEARTSVFAIGTIISAFAGEGSPFPQESTAVMLKNVAKGLRQELSIQCYAPFATLIRRCWEQNSLARPTIEDVHTELKEIRDTTMKPRSCC